MENTLAQCVLCFQRSVDSLTTLCVDYILKNLPKFINNYDYFKILPSHIKDRMLRKFVSSSFYWKNVDFKSTLSVFVHPLLKQIDLSLAAIDDELLEILKDCHNLQHIYLTRHINKICSSQSLINFVSSLEKLQSLQVSNCIAVNDDVLVTISKNCPILASFDASGCTKITDIGLEELSNLKNLTWLSFTLTQISDKGIESLVTGSSGIKIKELRIASCKFITNNVLHTILQYCPNLEVLIYCNTGLDDFEHDYQCSIIKKPHKDFKKLKQLTWTVHW